MRSLTLRLLVLETKRYDKWFPLSSSQARSCFEDTEAPVKRIENIMRAGWLGAFLPPEQFLEKLLKHVRRPAYASSAREHPFPLPKTRDQESGI